VFTIIFIVLFLYKEFICITLFVPDIILDNSGFELFTDLCLAEILVARGMCHKVQLHAKAMPWFVSDVTASDLHWTLDQLSVCMPELGSRWKEHFQTGKWVLYPTEKSYFWTLPCDYNSMQQASLYRQFK
jgi:hypothetical protein